LETASYSRFLLNSSPTLVAFCIHRYLGFFPTDASLLLVRMNYVTWKSGCEIRFSICGFYLQCKSCVLCGFVSEQSLNLFRGLNWSFMLKKREPSKSFTLPRSVLNFLCICVCVHVRAEDLNWTKLDCKAVSSQVPSLYMHYACMWWANS
jgi:hypothetical protein